MLQDLKEHVKRIDIIHQNFADPKYRAEQEASHQDKSQIKSRLMESIGRVRPQTGSTSPRLNNSSSAFLSRSRSRSKMKHKHTNGY